MNASKSKMTILPLEDGKNIKEILPRIMLGLKKIKELRSISILTGYRQYIYLTTDNKAAIIKARDPYVNGVCFYTILTPGTSRIFSKT